MNILYVSLPPWRDCFVLDPEDPHCATALHAYARSCEAENPGLAAELRSFVLRRALQPPGTALCDIVGTDGRRMLSLRALNALTNIGIDTLGQLAAVTYPQLRRTNNIGLVSIREIEALRLALNLGAIPEAP
jgi:hypothetical protein